jgi:metal-responsive CopG/Arc/MetJ family transcriptional regulator
MYARMTITLPADLREYIFKRAEREERSASHVVATLIRQAITRDARSRKGRAAAKKRRTAA